MKRSSTAGAMPSWFDKLTMKAFSVRLRGDCRRHAIRAAASNRPLWIGKRGFMSKIWDANPCSVAAVSHNQDTWFVPLRIRQQEPAMTIATTQPGRTADRVGPGLHVTLRSVIETLRLWRRRARERAELAQFTERDLRDIGIGRVEAQQEINKPMWRA
jgi:uncharacterized protein YjiS (DUF1127 family)